MHHNRQANREQAPNPTYDGYPIVHGTYSASTEEVLTRMARRLKVHDSRVSTPNTLPVFELMEDHQMRMAQLMTLLTILYGNAIRPYCYGQWWEDTLKKKPQDSDRRANSEWKRISSYVASYAVRLRRTSLLSGLGSPHVNPYGMWSLTDTHRLP